MNTMKRFLALLLMLCIVLSFAACSEKEDDTGDTNESQSVETTTEGGNNETTEEDTSSDLTTYTITVVDEAGNPMPGVMVQICQDTCLPGITDANGVAQFSVTEADYKASVASMPEGYSYSTEEDAFYFENGSYELTITLKANAEG